MEKKEMEAFADAMALSAELKKLVAKTYSEENPFLIYVAMLNATCELGELVEMSKKDQKELLEAFCIHIYEGK